VPEMISKLDNFLDDYADLETFARAVGRHTKTIRRYMDEKDPDGLPYTRMGNRILIHIPTAKSWLLSRMRRPNPRREHKRRPNPRPEHKGRRLSAPTASA
jgi:hypothetical protein